MADVLNPMPGMEVEISVQGMQASRFEAIEAAEAERSTAETERESAESARAGAEQARVNSESARRAAESGRKAAEEAREQNEAARAEAEGGRVTAESARVEAENLRALAETGRAASEAARVTAESARVSAEQVRADAEAGREAAEAVRQETFDRNEVCRQETFEAAENDRATAEAAREAAESARQAAFETNESNRQAAFGAAEAARASAETARAEAESGRAAAEALRAETFAGYESRFDTKLDNTPDAWPAWTADEQATARERIWLDKPYELIEEIALEEDTALFMRDAEPDGTSYNFKNVVVLVTSAKTAVGSKTIYTRIYNGDKSQSAYCVYTENLDYYKRAVWRAKIENSELRFATIDASYIYSAQNAISGDTFTYKESPNCNLVNDNITKIEISCRNNIPVGFLIQIFGVRA